MKTSRVEKFQWWLDGLSEGNQWLHDVNLIFWSRDLCRPLNELFRFGANRGLVKKGSELWTGTRLAWPEVGREGGGGGTSGPEVGVGGWLGQDVDRSETTIIEQESAGERKKMVALNYSNATICKWNSKCHSPTILHLTLEAEQIKLGSSTSCREAPT